MNPIVIRRGDWLPAIRALEPTQAVAAIGDVHGHDDLLAALSDALAEDLSAAAQKTFVQLGDLVDRGPSSIAALRRAKAGLPGAETIVLMGNHEERMLSAALGRAGPDELAAWFDFGGRETLACAGVDPEAAGWPERFRDVAGRDLLDWVAGLPRSHRLGQLLFVHAGIEPRVPLDRQDAEALIWIRGPFLDSPGPYPEGVAVIHGHTPQALVDLTHPHRINLDTGAFRTGILSGLVIAGDRMRLVQATR